ncbi:MAG: carbohydrate kinase [Candidatus Latescibacterota bacterium]
MIAHKDDLLLVGLGEILWDQLPSGKKLGGAPANFAYHAHALGGIGAVVSCIGDDPLGRELLAKLDALDLKRDHVIVDKLYPTGTVSVQVDPSGHPSYTIHEPVAWDFIRESLQLLELAARADAVCFGSLAQRSEVSRRTIQSILRATRSSCLRIFDVNLRQSFYSREVISTSLELAHILKINDEELPVVADMLSLSGDESPILEALAIRYNLGIIALTRGDRGSLLYSTGRISEHKGHPAQVADTVGAGDSFTAALALGVLRGDDLDQINDHANRLASFVCSQVGATPALPGEFLS